MQQTYSTSPLLKTLRVIRHIENQIVAFQEEKKGINTTN